MGDVGELNAAPKDKLCINRNTRNPKLDIIKTHMLQKLQCNVQISRSTFNSYKQRKQRDTQKRINRCRCVD
ncbi:unnamed protein product [Brassica rapa subsp. trilocularis]